MPSELHFAALFCAALAGGETEVAHVYHAAGAPHRIRVDCETPDAVIEVGLDKRSSLDSVQQALFAAALTGKTPVVAIVDTDATEGPYELRIRTAAAMAGVEYLALAARAMAPPVPRPPHRGLQAALRDTQASRLGRP
ncbi:hypothetical protein [Mesobaculum littorinae]|uniref:hypothetical protein n=1 Tax=Mesobaculum littorinae TaxID=2486419 RepID=UPI001F2447CB|nr:hypothetical protein [Mesobaculum littorinae]